MEKGLIGRKLGMTQIFAADGASVPVTVIEAGPCYVIQKKTEEKLKSVLNVRSKIELVEKGSIPRTAGKSKKVVDRRDVYSKDDKEKT